MCPACIASAAILATKAAAIGGAASVLAKKIHSKIKGQTTQVAASGGGK